MPTRQAMDLDTMDLRQQFRSDIPLEFIQALQAQLEESYQQAHGKLANDLYLPELSDTLPYLQRAYAERSLRRSASSFERLQIHTRKNGAENWNHYEVEGEQFKLTISRLRRPSKVVRPASYRTTLTRKGFLFPQDVPCHAIFLHGPEQKHPDRLGFLRVGIPNIAYSEYVDSFDPLAIYGASKGGTNVTDQERIPDQAFAKLRQADNQRSDTG